MNGEDLYPSSETAQIYQRLSAGEIAMLLGLDPAFTLPAVCLNRTARMAEARRLIGAEHLAGMRPGDIRAEAVETEKGKQAIAIRAEAAA